MAHWACISIKWQSAGAKLWVPSTDGQVLSILPWSLLFAQCVHMPLTPGVCCLQEGAQRMRLLNE